jgi:succinyl-CoA synthetase alpha subunit
MAKGFKVLPNRYYDSVFLMQVAQRISSGEGVVQAAALMATDNNKKILTEIGYSDPEIDASSATDLIIAVEAETESILDKVLANIEVWLTRPPAKSGLRQSTSFAEALTHLPSTNLVVISVPGQYAAHEAENALSEGKNVLLFSSNVSIEDEVMLKRLAQKEGLLLMGPDCGTAIVAGIGVGFANFVRRGNIGAIGVAGTGLQEFTSLVHRSGAGISHALGTGGRDLSDQVGGLTTLAALEALEADEGTDVIALVSKPPGATTLKAILPRLQATSKPLVVCLLGVEQTPDDSIRWASTIDNAVSMAVELAGTESISGLLVPEEQLIQLANEQRALLGEGQDYIRGIFAGGTFCYQAQTIMRNHGLRVHSNAPLPGMPELTDHQVSQDHTLVDMGDENYTSTRPHPMIDATYRAQRLLTDGADPKTAVLLLDFVLGYNAAKDPVGDLIPSIKEVQSAAEARGTHLCIVASVCGTELDPQDFAGQEEALHQAGCVVLPTNAQASEFAARVVLSPNRGAG